MDVDVDEVLEAEEGAAASGDTEERVEGTMVATMTATTGRVDTKEDTKGGMELKATALTKVRDREWTSGGEEGEMGE